MQWFKNSLAIRIILFTALAIFTGLLSCNNDIPNDGIPAYIHVSETNVVTQPVEGSGSHNISDIWVQIGDQDLGAYELPVTFPVLAEGLNKVVVRAGIKDNGISGSRTIYPFYRLDSITLDLMRTKTTSFQPSFRYFDGTKFAIIEDFEFGNMFNGMTRTSNSSEVFEGSGSGLILLDDLNPVAEAKTNQLTQIPVGASTYIELDYKSNIFFTIRLQGVENSGQTLTIDKLFVAPQDTWNKIYVNISNEVGQLRADNYNFIFAATKTDTLTTARIFIDNFKVVHF